MRHRVVVALFAAGLLGGCSSSFWDNALEYPSLTQHQDTAANEPAAEATVPATTAAVGTAPFVSVPEARPLGSTDQAHQTLRAGTTPPTAVQPKTAAVPPDASAPAAPVAVAAVPPPVVQTAPPAPSYTPPMSPPRDEMPAAQPNSAPASIASAAPATGDDWCVRVAKSAQAEAAEQGFDAATQQRRSLAAFKQCSANVR